MSSVADTRPASMVGAAWALLAVLCFSTNDAFIKFLSGDYPLHQVVLLRSFVGLAVLMAVVVPLSGGYGALRTRRPGMHLVRGLCVVFANMCFFLGLAALPLAEAVAVFFVAPLLVALASVVFLGETVGPRRWAAIAVGLVGVVVVLRPGTEAFRPAALLPLCAACGYTGLHILTRRIGATETAPMLAVSIQVVFLASSGAIGLALGHGGFAGSGHPSLEFLLRAWHWPEPADLGIMAGVGAASAVGGYAIGQAYRLSEAALVAPVEYAALPLALFWGIAVFGEWPDTPALLGIGLILLAGLVLVWREAEARRRHPSRPPGAR